MAKDVKFLISANVDRAEAAIRELQRTGNDVSDRLGSSFDTLGIRSSASAEKQRAAYVSAFEKIKASGVASAADIEKAHAAMNSKLADLDKDPGLQKIGRGAKDAAADVQGLTGYVGILSESLIRLAGPVALGAFISQTISAALAQEKFTASMEASTGSSQAAAREIQFIREESQRLGLDFVSTAGSFAKFTASTRNTSIEGEATRKIFVGVSEAVTAMKLSGDEANGIFLALSQMMSKGKVSAEELNGQLGERLPGALKLTADAMGMTTAELLKQMEQGKLMSSDVLPKLAEQLHKTYGESAKKAAEGGQSAINRFNNEVKETASAIGSKLMPGLNAVAGKMASMMKTARENPPGWFKNWAFVLGITDVDTYMGTPKKVASQKSDPELAAETVRTDAAKQKEAAERAKAAAETQKKEAAKQHADAVKAAQDKGRAIIDTEKDIVRQRLDLEKEFGARLKETYKERVTELETFRKAAEDVLASKAERDKKRADEQAALLRGPEDSFQRYARVQDELVQQQIDLDNESPWSVAGITAKIKAQDGLIRKSEEQLAAVKAGHVQNISLEQAEWDHRVLRESLETRINDSIKEQTRLLEDSAVKAAGESDAQQQRIKATQGEISVLDRMLKNLPSIKDIKINLKVTGMADLQRIPGLMQGTGVDTTDYSEEALRAAVGDSVYNSWPKYEVGTDYVPRTGPAIVHKGEKIIPANQNTGSAPITIQSAQFILPNVTNQTSASELFRQLIPMLDKYNERTKRRA